jgi:hypothetical protein
MDEVYWTDIVKPLAASCLSQDEIRGVASTKSTPAQRRLFKKRVAMAEQHFLTSLGGVKTKAKRRG